MIDITYKPGFLKELGGLEKSLQDEVLEKIDLLRDPKNHRQLRVHKLHGRLRTRNSFSVNYRYRVVFSYTSKKEVALLAVGDHDVYK